MQGVPVVDVDDPAFEKKLDHLLSATLGSSDYDNSRDRPYNGQMWTDQGERGKTEVKGLTMRDLADCMIQGFLCCADPDVPEQLELMHSVTEIHKEFFGTKYANKGTWRYGDVYKLDLTKLDPQAMVKNTLCFVEHMMGIFPNVDELKCKEVTDKMFTEEREKF
jgi:hypothetical protein